MVYLNLQISLPVRVVCVQCGQDLKLEGQGPTPNSCTVKCPGCGWRGRLIQAEPPRALPQPKGLPRFQPPPPRT